MALNLKLLRFFFSSGFAVLARCQCWFSEVRASSREVQVVSLIESHLRQFYDPRDSSCYDSPRNSAADGVFMASFSFLAYLYVRLLFMAQRHSLTSLLATCTDFQLPEQCIAGLFVSCFCCPSAAFIESALVGVPLASVSFLFV